MNDKWTAARGRIGVAADPDDVSGEKQEATNPAEDPQIMSENLDLARSIISCHTEGFHNGSRDTACNTGYPGPADQATFGPRATHLRDLQRAGTNVLP
jgi:hypothetical protein